MKCDTCKVNGGSVKPDDTEAFNDFESPVDDDDEDLPDENGGYVIPF